jgi:hypothetical protein
MSPRLFQTLLSLLEELPASACRTLLAHLCAVIERPDGKGRARATVAAGSAILTHVRWARREAIGAEDRARRDEARLRAASEEELRSSIRQAAAEALTPDELRVALAEAEARTSGGGGAS